MLTLKNNLKTAQFSWILSLLNLLLFHWPFYQFVFHHLDYVSLSGVAIIASLFILMLVVNFFVFFLLLSISPIVGKILISLFFILNAICIYFIINYGVIIDGIMIGNLINTDFEESSSFFSLKLVLYTLILGVLPAVFIFKTKMIKVTKKSFFVTISASLLFITAMVFANASNWLWIDKNSPSLGALAMPWSYSVNTALHYIHEHQKNEKEILLPNITKQDSARSIVVLVIGESARSENFSLYGYAKNTNPLLSQTPNLYHFKANSFATYTTAGVKSILEHTHTDDLYEILPNYLFRNQIEVIWRTTNWGEPPVHIKNYADKNVLQKDCAGDSCEYDGILLRGLKEQIMASDKKKILVVLHTSTSHGPTYSKKYPAQFEKFKPVCNSVELGNCTQTELINAYDNTIVYTDFILHELIEDLKQLPQYKSCMLFVSDHGESLGEKNLYMHGMPKSLAPKEQYEIPFLVWLSDNSAKQLKPLPEVTQNHVFHSVLNFMGLQSPVYNEEMNIFK